jgi:hypothetical protein
MTQDVRLGRRAVDDQAARALDLGHSQSHHQDRSSNATPLISGLFKPKLSLGALEQILPGVPPRRQVRCSRPIASMPAATLPQTPISRPFKITAGLFRGPD